MSPENIKLNQSINDNQELNLYDLHLSSSRYHTLPDLSGLAEKVPADLQPTWDNLTQTLGQKLVPGFMGLSLSADLAAELLERIERAGGYGLVVPIGYRHPKITVEMAYPIAERETVRRQAERNYKEVEPTKFCRDGVMWWEFRAGVPELIEKGYIPGSIVVWVDKLDGHFWTAVEQIHHSYGEEYYLESATSLEPMEVLNLAATQLGLEWSTDHKHQNQPCLKAPALVIGAVESKSPNFLIEQKYGFRQAFHMWFRLNRHKQGYEAAGPLMMQVVNLVLQQDPADAILVFDEGETVDVLQRIAGKLTINERWSSWREVDSLRSLVDVPTTTSHSG